MCIVPSRMLCILHTTYFAFLPLFTTVNQLIKKTSAVAVPGDTNLIECKVPKLLQPLHNYKLKMSIETNGNNVQ